MKKYHPSPFFIIGSGRSGSTLLRLILSSHSCISIPPETWFILPLTEQLPMTSVLSKTEVKTAIDIITFHYRWPDMVIDKREFHLWATGIDEPRLKDILNLIYEHYLKLEKKSIWGDKTPPYIKIVPELSLLYPDAKFIHIIRDGRDVAKSFQSKKWYGKWLFRNTIEWKEAMTRYNELKSTGLAAKIIEIKYEDLVMNTEKSVKDICSFLEICFEPGMLDWKNQAHKKIPKRELHIHDNIFKNPEKSDAQKWRKELTRIQILIAESFLYKELNSVGYDLKFKAMIWKPIFYIVRTGLNTFYFFYLKSKKIYGFLKTALYLN